MAHHHSHVESRKGRVTPRFPFHGTSPVRASFGVCDWWAVPTLPGSTAAVSSEEPHMKKMGKDVRGTYLSPHIGENFLRGEVVI
jgi:hypothetical protein